MLYDSPTYSIIFFFVMCLSPNSLMSNYVTEAGCASVFKQAEHQCLGTSNPKGWTKLATFLAWRPKQCRLPKSSVTMDTVKKIAIEVSIASSTHWELRPVQNYTKFWKYESEDIWQKFFVVWLVHRIAFACTWRHNNRSNKETNSQMEWEQNTLEQRASGGECM
jgi:hypothetical protein